MKHFVVWSLETICEVALLIPLLMLFEDPSQRFPITLTDLSSFLFAIGLFMVGSGYLLTTAIVGNFFRSQTSWGYPLTTALLFVVHEMFFLGRWRAPERSDAIVQAVGACIVFACTFVGGRFLRGWMKTDGEEGAQVLPRSLR
jgi:hypothetical protein